MGIGVSIFLIAVGAILKYAVTASARGIDLGAMGVILMVVGSLGLLTSLVFWGSWGGYGFQSRRVVTHRGPSRYGMSDGEPLANDVTEERREVYR
jgi:uncharacterized protein DUF6458